MKNIRYLAASFAATVILLILLLISLQGPPVSATSFGNVVSASSIRSTTYINSGSYITVGTFFEGNPQIFTVVNVTPITPTRSVLLLTESGTVTVTTIVAGPANAMLFVRNTAAQTVNVVDGSNLKLASTFAMGQYDTLMLISDGTNWIETARANN